MCGLFGFDLPGVDKISLTRLVTALALGNETRGDDSWGVWTDAGVERGLGGAVDAIGRISAHNRAMAHTRYATYGEVTIDNAHPLVSGGVTGCHNGQVWNATELDRLYGRNVGVDSQHIFDHLSEGMPLSDIQGYGSITWVDSEDTSKIMICRLQRGSLAIAGVGPANAPTGVVWSSDAEHLKLAMRALGVKYHTYVVPEGVTHEVKGGRILQSRRKRLKLSDAPRAARETDLVDYSDRWPSDAWMDRYAE